MHWDKKNGSAHDGIAVRKCHPKFTCTCTPETGGEGQEYEGGKGGVAVSDPTNLKVASNHYFRVVPLTYVNMLVILLWTVRLQIYYS